MQLPDYWLPRPPLSLDAEVLHQLEALYATVALGRGDWMEELPLPAWQFLCWLTDRKGHLLHGTGDPAIPCFEPRQSNDAGEFGGRKAVYAASDGIWPIFFAVVDRERYPMTLTNAAIRVEGPEGRAQESYYYFALTDQVLARQPWREGVVYVLPKEGFEQESPRQVEGAIIHTNHWASLNPVKPLAKLRVRPSDFPFLGQIRPQDDQELMKRIRANPEGFPWQD